PLKLLDCCPISDGAMALVVSATPAADAAIAIRGAGQGHRHKHLSGIEDTTTCGARDSSRRAFAEAGLAPADIDLLGIYDSFTITLAILLEEIGFAPRGGCARRLRAGDFALDGPLPLNTHGGLLSFGPCGVAGGMGRAVEAFRLLAGRADDRPVPGRRRALAPSS